MDPFRRAPFPLSPPSGMPPGTPSPDMAHPPYNPGGMYPGEASKRGVEVYGEPVGQNWQFDAVDSVWRWTVSTPVLNMRPGLMTALGNAGTVTAYPVNHDAALGLNCYLNVLFGCESANNVAPAAWPLISCDYWEDGHSTSADQLYRLTQVINVTDTLIAGGTLSVSPFGGSNLNFTPPAGLRFWRLNVRLSVPGVVDVRPSTAWVAWLMMH